MHWRQFSTKVLINIFYLLLIKEMPNDTKDVSTVHPGGINALQVLFIASLIKCTVSVQTYSTFLFSLNSEHWKVKYVGFYSMRRETKRQTGQIYNKKQKTRSRESRCIFPGPFTFTLSKKNQEWSQHRNLVWDERASARLWIVPILNQVNLFYGVCSMVWDCSTEIFLH